ncbi:MAG: hypothetical protein MN733_29505, partial [Nitrososphaera sp.]|nr:hypothetical protein [Nitrososphaera sp.]
LTSLAAGTESAHAVQPKPLTSTSWYVNGPAPSGDSDLTMQNWMQAKGYELGQRDLNTPGTQISAVILHFFSPSIQGGIYGASGYNRFRSVVAIKEAARRFALGYWNGSGSDTASQLFMLVGTSNSGINNYTDQFLYNHGAAWVQMIKDTATAIQSYASQVKVRGAADIEVNYSSFSKAAQWAVGYDSGYINPYYLYYYGDAGGCVNGTDEVAPITPTSCNNGWNQDDVECLSWGCVNASIPFPQIYSTAGGNAKSWKDLKLYSYLQYGAGMFISSPLSQSAACAQKGGCSGINNTPEQAWDQLWTWLNGDSRTAQSLEVSTDIKWRY